MEGALGVSGDVLDDEARLSSLHSEESRASAVSLLCLDIFLLCFRVGVLVVLMTTVGGSGLI